MRAATVRAARAVALPMKFLGERLRRLEDHRFLSGRGRSVADLALPGMLDMVLVRSPHAHTRIRTVDVEVARRGEDVVVDAATGAFAVLGYFMSQDSGRLINLFIAEGQLQGGRRAGCRQRAVGGDRGAGPATLMRYASLHRRSRWRISRPSPTKLLCCKGVGESGLRPTAAAVAAAVEDVLRDRGLRVDRMPLTAPRLRELIRTGGE